MEIHYFKPYFEKLLSQDSQRENVFLFAISLDIINPRDISTEDLHKSVNLMTLDNRHQLLLMNLMHKYKEHRPWLHENALNTGNADKITFATEVSNLSVY